MTDTLFRPFETALDRPSALRHLQAATDGADDGELFFETGARNRWSSTTGG